MFSMHIISDFISNLSMLGITTTVTSDLDTMCGTVEAKTKEWRGNHIDKGASKQGSGIVESNRQDNMLEDGT